MGIYDNFNDAPDQIKIEGQEITLTCKNLGDGTMLVSWNIPAPSTGCKGNGVYDGIVITVDTNPANYLSTSPSDGTFYEGDTTLDNDLHLGSKIDTANVLVALYNNRVTTEVLLTDVKPQTPYYISGYAVDKVGRYHREGVHAYSIPTGEKENRNPGDSVSYLDVEVCVNDPLSGSSLTGLAPATDYDLSFILDRKKKYTVTVNGSDASDFDSLISALNTQLKLAVQAPSDTEFPNTGSYHVVNDDLLVKLWDGSSYTVLDSIFSDTDPTTTNGSFWYQPSSKALKTDTGTGWETSEFIDMEADPTVLSCGDLWFNGTDAYRWEDTFWLKLPTRVSTTHPLGKPEMTCNDFWYDPSEQLLKKWDIKTKSWLIVNAMYYSKDPETINTGDYWFDTTSNELYQFVAGDWGELVYRTDAPDGDGEISGPDPLPLSYWFIEDTQTLYQRNAANDEWEEREVLFYAVDPRVRQSGDIWWDSDTDLIYRWDIIDGEWEAAPDFSQSSIDPSLPSSISTDTIWYNPTDGIITVINGDDCSPVNVIHHTQAPDRFQDGVIWFDGTTWRVWDSGAWATLTVVTAELFPQPIPDDFLWFNIDTDELFLRDQGSWTPLVFTQVDLTPTDGDLFVITPSNDLYVWSSGAWTLSDGIIKASLHLRKYLKGTDFIRIETTGTGCGSLIELVFTDADLELFAALDYSLYYHEPVSGDTRLVPGPISSQLGVGDDGSPDERRKLHTDIRVALGAPSAQVELTKESLDICIDNALLKLSMFSNIPTTRQLFFLELKPNQQHYQLTNKCVGFNKIDNVVNLYRIGGSFLSANSFGFGPLSQFSALQSLYRTGTFDTVGYHLMTAHMEELEQLFATKLMFQWVKTERKLSIYKRIHQHERILVDATIQRPEQDILTDSKCKLWLKKWAIAEAKMSLSHVRGKYQSLPGPNGSTTLNSQELITQAENEFSVLEEQVKDMSMQDASQITSASFFVVG